MSGSGNFGPASSSKGSEVSEARAGASSGSAASAELVVRQLLLRLLVGTEEDRARAEEDRARGARMGARVESLALAVSVLASSGASVAASDVDAAWTTASDAAALGEVQELLRGSPSGGGGARLSPVEPLGGPGATLSPPTGAAPAWRGDCGA